MKSIWQHATGTSAGGTQSLENCAEMAVTSQVTTTTAAATPAALHAAPPCSTGITTE
jgi:hypothetical protein